MSSEYLHSHLKSEVASVKVFCQSLFQEQSISTSRSLELSVKVRALPGGQVNLKAKKVQIDLDQLAAVCIIT